MDALRPYAAAFSSRFLLMMQYRAAALAGFFTQCWFGAVHVMVLAAFYLGAPDAAAASPITRNAVINRIPASVVRSRTNYAIPPRPAILQAAPAEDSGFYYEDDTGEAQAEPEVFEGPTTPGVHVVRTGDTLWDICGYYFNDSWQWPKVWGYNTRPPCQTRR